MSKKTPLNYFKCNNCNGCVRTYRYGMKEGKSLNCKCQKGIIERETGMLENIIENLIAAIGANTVALNAVGSGAKPKEEKAETETTTQKKARIKREKKAAKNGGTKPAEKITAADVKKQAKEIAIATDDPHRCMDQIKLIVAEIAEDRLNDGNLSLDAFDGPSLYIFEERLKAFEYGAEEAEEAKDDLTI